MKKFIIAVAISLTINSFGALPPGVQCAKEIEAILASKELFNHIPISDVIERISRNSEGYEIVTNKHRVQVLLHYLPTNCCGPCKFDLEFLEIQVL